MKQKPILGKKWGKLTLVEPVQGNHGKPSYRFACDCGGEIIARFFETIKRDKPQCRVCYKADLKGTTNARRVSPLDRTINVAWYRFRQASKNKGGVNLSKDEWLKLVQSDCHFCGSAPSNLWKAVEPWAEDFSYQGIDRIDSLVGYTSDNCQPCCWICNRMKSNMDERKFIEHLRRVLRKVNNG